MELFAEFSTERQKELARKNCFLLNNMGLPYNFSSQERGESQRLILITNQKHVYGKLEDKQNGSPPSIKDLCHFK